jgi:hypothetical protein
MFKSSYPLMIDDVRKLIKLAKVDLNVLPLGPILKQPTDLKTIEEELKELNTARVSNSAMIQKFKEDKDFVKDYSVDSVILEGIVEIKKLHKKIELLVAQIRLIEEKNKCLENKSTEDIIMEKNREITKYGDINQKLILRINIFEERKMNLVLLKEYGFDSEEEMIEFKNKQIIMLDEIENAIDTLKKFDNGQFKKGSLKNDYIKRCFEYVNKNSVFGCSVEKCRNTFTLCVNNNNFDDFKTKLIKRYEFIRSFNVIDKKKFINLSSDHACTLKYLEVVTQHILEAHIKYNNELIRKNFNYKMKNKCPLCEDKMYCKRINTYGPTETKCKIINIVGNSQCAYSTICHQKFRVIPETDLLTIISLDSLLPRVKYVPDGYYSDDIDNSD